MGRGAFPDGNELCLEMPGMHGNYTATTSIQNADLLIAIGVRFDDRKSMVLFEISRLIMSPSLHIDIGPLSKLSGAT